MSYVLKSEYDGYVAEESTTAFSESSIGRKTWASVFIFPRPDSGFATDPATHASPRLPRMTIANRHPEKQNSAGQSSSWAERGEAWVATAFLSSNEPKTATTQTRRKNPVRDVPDETGKDERRVIIRRFSSPAAD